MWTAPEGMTPLGFHVAHLSGSTDRLLTYARGSVLDAEQKAALGRERMIGVERPPVERLVHEWNATVDRALAMLEQTATKKASFDHRRLAEQSILWLLKAKLDPKADVTALQARAVQQHQRLATLRPLLARRVVPYLPAAPVAKTAAQ